MDHPLRASRAGLPACGPALAGPSRGYRRQPGGAGPRRSLVLVCAAAVAGAFAEPNPYYLGVSQSIAHDDNLLRLADGQAVPPDGVKADTIYSTGLVGGFDQNIGRQHLFGNATVRDNRLTNNTVDNNVSYALASGIDWSTAGRVSGALKFNAGRNLAQFANNQGQFELTQRNLESTRQIDGQLRVGTDTRFSAELGAGYRSVDYSLALFDPLDFHQSDNSLGLRWRPDGAANFGATVHQARGHYPKALQLLGGTTEADAFTRRELSFDADLQPSGPSRLTAGLSVTKIAYDTRTERDFSGVTGYLRWLWQASGKLRLDTQLSRDPGQDSYFRSFGFVFNPDGTIGQSLGTVEYSRVSNSLRLRADYEVTAKIGVYANLGVTQRSLTQTLSNPTAASNSQTGSDHGRSHGFGASWAPLRSVQLGCDWAQETRSGQPPVSSNFRDTSYSCYGQFVIQ